MKFKKLESGRSMVEMLGVLAIIGVLSVGGIAGYSLSMRRHRANNVADIASKYALVAYNQCQKLVLDGSVDDDYCSSTYLATFDNADVGTKPAGVSNISGVAVMVDTNLVHFSVHFDDDKLCQAYASIVGSSCNTSNKVVNQTIKQN